MVQEVVTGFLTFSQKRFLHGRIAAYLSNSSDVSHATLANHFELAAKGMSQAELNVPQCKRAIWFLKLAAEDSMKVGAIDDANKYLARCEGLMEMLPASSDPFDLETALTLTDGNELVEEQPKLVAYRERAQARPAYQRALKAQLSDFEDQQPMQMEGN